jgi:hypothetical protein
MVERNVVVVIQLTVGAVVAVAVEKGDLDTGVEQRAELAHIAAAEVAREDKVFASQSAHRVSLAAFAKVRFARDGLPL